MSTIAFLSIGTHGHINPTLPVIAELVRRGHTVTYHTSPAFRQEIEATGATVRLYPGGQQPLPDPPTPVTLLEPLASTSLGTQWVCDSRGRAGQTLPDRPTEYARLRHRRTRCHR